MKARPLNIVRRWARWGVASQRVLEALALIHPYVIDVHFTGKYQVLVIGLLETRRQTQVQDDGLQR
jgi:hypothetical protein